MLKVTISTNPVLLSIVLFRTNSLKLGIKLYIFFHSENVLENVISAIPWIGLICWVSFNTMIEKKYSRDFAGGGVGCAILNRQLVLYVVQL